MVWSAKKFLLHALPRLGRGPPPSAIGRSRLSSPPGVLISSHPWFKQHYDNPSLRDPLREKIPGDTNFYHTWAPVV